MGQELLDLYDSALPQVFGYLVHRSGDVGVAEDLTAEVFLAAVDALRRDAVPDLSVYVPDVDATYALAIDRGAVSERPPEDQFYGDRAGWLVDPFGHTWSIHTWLGDR